jgi:cytochrome c551/c552
VQIVAAGAKTWPDAQPGQVTAEIVVVDNASDDGSAQMVQAEFPQANLTANRHNAGFAAANNQAIAQARGQALFFGKAQCASCHKPDVDMTGPALKGALSRWPDKQTLYDFIRNPTNVIQRDKYALALYEKWNRANMLPFPHLTDAEIDAILSYCDSYVRP